MKAEVEEEEQAGKQLQEEEEEEEEGGNPRGCSAPALRTSLCWCWDSEPQEPQEPHWSSLEPRSSRSEAPP